MSDNYGAQRWVSFLNDSGEEIPSYAAIMLVSDAGTPSTAVNFAKRLKAKQFTTASDTGVYAFNSRVPVPAGKYGKCTFAVDGPAWARIRQVDVTAGIDISADDDWLGQEFGPLDSVWSIGPTGRGYTLLTRPYQLLTDANWWRVLVMAKPARYPLLMKNGTEDTIGGPATVAKSGGGNGIETEVLCYFVTQDGDHSSEEDARVTVNFESLQGWVFPSYPPTTDESVSPVTCCWAVPWKDGKWKAISGGIQYFETEFDGTYVDTTALGGSSSPSVEAFPFCDETIPANTTCGVQMYHDGSLTIIAHCCPELA